MIAVRRSTWMPFVVLIASSLAFRAQAQPAAPALPDIQKLGPQVGARVPDFTLTDQQGRSHTLTSLLEPRGLMLVFFRSADW